MRYTPEELYDYCRDNGLLYALYRAAAEETRGFVYSFAPGNLTLHGHTLHLVDCLGGESDFDAKDQIEAFGPPALGDIIFAVCAFPGQQNMVMFCSDKKDGFKESEAFLELWPQILIMFLRWAGVDTIGRLRKLIKEGLLLEEIHDKQERRLEKFEGPSSKKLQYAIDTFHPKEVTMTLDDECNPVFNLELDDITGATLMAEQALKDLYSYDLEEIAAREFAGLC